jgi:hypothetical protein
MSGTAVVAWNQAALEAVRRTRLGPPMVARAVHVLHTAMYDAWAAYDERSAAVRLGVTSCGARTPNVARRPSRRRSVSPPTTPWLTCSRPSGT